jgi:hypothetical protein
MGMGENKKERNLRMGKQEFLFLLIFFAYHHCFLPHRMR